jgi:hypothetical protein
MLCARLQDVKEVAISVKKSVTTLQQEFQPDAKPEQQGDSAGHHDRAVSYDSDKDLDVGLGVCFPGRFQFTLTSSGVLLVPFRSLAHKDTELKSVAGVYGYQFCFSACLFCNVFFYTSEPLCGWLLLRSHGVTCDILLQAIDQQVDQIASAAGKALGSLWTGIGGAFTSTAQAASAVAGQLEQAALQATSNSRRSSPWYRPPLLDWLS